ncbi:hypothetical protein [Dyadobacter sp. LHD-138]|uniref:hypothetical protein n=1 Tax=Dyadobacter sp. LHD-138 TaxID=3071413 RepID=UPI0027E12C67|nr:hypothetical protein [Dyadobacter sp. LHD-138]MDQ6481708.1 hypothetical protein [Dyadobacter sp. LHD-138]
MDNTLAREKAEALNEQTKDKSDDDYEKNVTYISAGTLVLSLTFLEKVVKLNDSHGLWFLISSWGFMALTLGINLVSHQLSSLFAEKNIESLTEVDANPTGVVATIQGRNKKLRILNWITTGTLFIGMVCLIIFCSINALTPQKPVMAEDRKINSDSLEQKGRTSIIPVSLQSTAKEVQAQADTSSDATAPQNQNSGSSQQKKD